MYIAKLTAALLVLLALVLGAVPAQAETVNCTPITSVPVAITEPGIYCFTGHLQTSITSGLAINIRTENVVLDLNGFELSGFTAGLGTQAVGIFAPNLRNITIKNGTIRGFLRGIWLTATGASLGYVVEDIRAEQNTHIGINVDGLGAIVRNNQVVATGGSTFFGTNLDAFGIFVSGASPRVLNNDVTHTVKQGAGIARAIFFLHVTDGLAVNNRITEADRGIEFFGVFGGSTGKFRDNLTSGVATPYLGFGAADAGNNN